MFDNIVNNIKGTDLNNFARNKIKENTPEINPNAFYIGIVINTNDFYKVGRVQVRIPMIHGGASFQRNYLPDSALPWAKPAIMIGAGNDMGQFIVPTKGTRVIVSFECGDLKRPLYFGCLPSLHKLDKYYNDNPCIYGGAEITIKDDDRIKDFRENTSQQVIYKSFKGATIIIDDQDGEENIKIIDQAGQIFEMGHKGNTLERRGSKILEKADSENYIKLSNGSAFIEMVGNTIKIKGNIEYVE